MRPGRDGRRYIARMQITSSVSGMIGVACYLFVPRPWKFLFVLLFCGIGLALSGRAILLSRARQARLHERLRNTRSTPE